jgi:hypothetical protein
VWWPNEFLGFSPFLCNFWKIPKFIFAQNSSENCAIVVFVSHLPVGLQNTTTEKAADLVEAAAVVAAKISSGGETIIRWQFL